MYRSKLDLMLFKNCQPYVYQKFLAFHIPHLNRTDDKAIRKPLLKSKIDRREK